MQRHGCYHPNSSYIYGRAQNTLERLAAESTKYDEEIGRARQKNVYYPFSDRGEWELAKFMCENLNRGQMSRFIKLEWVSDNRLIVSTSNSSNKFQFQKKDKLSFKSADKLLSWMDSLPQGPRWRCTKIEMDDYVTVHPVYLLWRDAFDVTQMIFGNPIFHQHMCLDPHEVYTEHNDREYGEWMSSQEAFRIQVNQPRSFSLSTLISSSGPSSRWSYDRPHYTCF